MNTTDFNYKDFSLENYLNESHSFEEIRVLMNNLLTALYECNEFEQALYNEDGIVIAEYATRANVMADLTKVAHLVLNNAFYILSDGVEGNYVYELTDEDKEHWTFAENPRLRNLSKIIYGGYEGIVDLLYEDDRRFADTDLDCQDIEMLASYLFDRVAMHYNVVATTDPIK